MNQIIQSTRSHYETLPPTIRERTTAKYLLAVIQEAKKMDGELEPLRFINQVEELEKGLLTDER